MRSAKRICPGSDPAGNVMEYLLANEPLVKLVRMVNLEPVASATTASVKLSVSKDASAIDESDPVIDDFIVNGENVTPLLSLNKVWISLLDPVAIKSVKPSALTSAKAKLVMFPEDRLIVMGLPKLPAPLP